MSEALVPTPFSSFPNACLGKISKKLLPRPMSFRLVFTRVAGRRHETGVSRSAFPNRSLGTRGTKAKGSGLPGSWRSRRIGSEAAVAQRQPSEARRRWFGTPEVCRNLSLESGELLKVQIYSPICQALSPELVRVSSRLALPGCTAFVSSVNPDLFRSLHLS